MAKIIKDIKYYSYLGYLHYLRLLYHRVHSYIVMALTVLAFYSGIQSGSYLTIMFSLFIFISIVVLKITKIEASRYAELTRLVNEYKKSYIEKYTDYSKIYEDQ